MRDAFGGVVNLVIIVVFLVLVSGYLAFNVNYTKAFRVKNKIISTFEQYEGNCQSSTTEVNTCNGEIVAYMKRIGYSAPDFNLTGEPDNYDKCHYGYCYKKIEVPKDSDSVDTETKVYYKIATQINIDIPIINKILPGLKIFQVTGDTMPITVVG